MASQKHIDNFKAFLTKKGIKPEDATKKDAAEYKESLKVNVGQSGDTFHIKDEKTGKTKLFQQKHVDEAGGIEKYLGTQGIETPTGVNITDVDKKKEEAPLVAQEGDVTPTETPEATVPPVTEDVKPKEEPKEEPKVETPRAPTEEEKKKFPEGTFQGPSPVALDKEGKLTTGVSPLELQPSAQELYATEKGVPFKRGSRNQIMFQPANLDEAIDLYSQFGPNVSIDKTSSAAIKGSTMYQKYSKYRGADTSTLLQGMKDNDIGVGGPTWDRLLRMNGGEPTVQMLEARKEYELGLKADIINNSGNIVAGDKADISNPVDSLDELDSLYMDKVNNYMEGAGEAWSTYKAKDAENADLRKTVKERNEQIQDLYNQKRLNLREIQKKYPGLPLGQQLELASRADDELSDKIYSLQRQQNIDTSILKDSTAQLEAEYEFKTKQAAVKMDFISDMYKAKRGDIIRQDQIERQDKLLADQIARSEKAQEEAIIRGDAQAAKNFAYDLALAKAKQDLNKDAFSNIKALGGDVFAIRDETTGDITFKKASDIGEAPTPTPTPTVPGVGTGQKTQDYGATSPVAGDNITLADGTVGTPGVDIDGSIGDSIKAFTSGKVVKADSHPNYGTRLVIEDNAGNLHMYNHLQTPIANVGDIITKGDEIATMGNTGTVIKGEAGDGSHLDYRVSSNGDISLKGGNWIDPNQFIEPTKEVRTEVLNGADVVLGSIGVPIVFERTIKSQIPATLLNSEVELKAANDVIKNLYKSGVTPEEASQMFQGFEIRSADDLKFGGQLIQVARTVNNPPEGLLGKLSANINTGGKKLALGTIERLKEAEYKTLEAMAPIRATSQAKFQRLNSVRDTINKLGGPGVLQGTWQQFIGRLKSSDLALLQTKMERLNAEERLRLFGTSQTGTESGSFDPLALQLGEQIQTLFNKIDEFKADELMLLNTHRGLTLPHLTEKELLDDWALVDLYEKGFGKRPEPISTPQKDTSYSSYKNRQTTQPNSSRFKSYISKP